MERIEFNYTYHSEDGEEKLISSSQRNESGVKSADICAMFIDFMESVGFDEESIMKYFR